MDLYFSRYYTAKILMEPANKFKSYFSETWKLVIH